MKKGFIATMLVALCASAALAADGLPSQGKLNKLGLSSMQAASDHDGMQVRGKAFSKVLFTWQASAGEKATRTIDSSGNPQITIDPANYVAHDFNNGAGILEDGIPLTIGGAFNSQVAVHSASADHEQVVLDSAGNVAFTEISSSRNSAKVFSGNMAQYIMVQPVLFP